MRVPSRANPDASVASMTGEQRVERPNKVRLVALLGPAFVASIAYVDPGNVGANLSAGATYGYGLVWVLVAASAMAALVQYQSAKLGLVTGRSLTSLVEAWLTQSGRPRAWIWAYGAQAFVVAIATDLAEVVGGALALYLLFGVPLWLGSLIVGVLSVLLLHALRRRGEHVFELAVGGVLAIVVVGFVGALAFAPPSWPRTIEGLVPFVPDQKAWLLVAAMLGATVMPHAIYLHSSLAVDRHFRNGRRLHPLPDLLRAQRWDVGSALAVAGTVNIAMLLLAATTLQDAGGDTIEAAYHVFMTTLGPLAAVIFAIGLLASGIGSAIVGTHAGSRVLKDLAPVRLSPTVRRVATVAPAVLILITGVSPTVVLVVSQAVLSFGIALAVVPLALFTRSPRVMGDHADGVGMQIVNALITVALIALNIVTIATL